MHAPSSGEEHRLAWRAVSDATNGAGRPLVSVVVPVYNEEKTVAQVVDELLELNLRLEILLVDDGSTDGSAAELARLAATHSQVTVLSQPRNMGKGAAVRRGIDDSHGDILLIQDADLEYSPSDIPALIDPLLTGKADAVFGTRLRGGAHPQRAHLFWHYAGNRFLTLLSNVLYNTTISDMEVGYKAFKGDLVRGLKLVSNDFRIEPELTAKILRLGPGIRLYEVPISYYGRSYAEGKKITWRDGFGAVGALFRFRFGG
jgi:glycosyltransferase involved in cell wall biosynthesis